MDWLSDFSGILDHHRHIFLSHSYVMNKFHGNLIYDSVLFYSGRKISWRFLGATFAYLYLEGGKKTMNE